MKKNKDREIVKSIDSITDLMNCVQNERLYLAELLGITIIHQPPMLHFANESQLTEIAMAYKMDIVITPRNSIEYLEELSITVNGVKLFTLA